MDWTIIGLLLMFMAGTWFGLLVLGMLRGGKTEPVDLDALATVTREQYTAGFAAGYNDGLDVGRAESMRRRVGQASEAVGRQPHQVAMQQARDSG